MDMTTELNVVLQDVVSSKEFLEFLAKLCWRRTAAPGVLFGPERLSENSIFSFDPFEQQVNHGDLN